MWAHLFLHVKYVAKVDYALKDGTFSKRTPRTPLLHEFYFAQFSALWFKICHAYNEILHCNVISCFYCVDELSYRLHLTGIAFIEIKWKIKGDFSFCSDVYYSQIAQAYPETNNKINSFECLFATRSANVSQLWGENCFSRSLVCKREIGRTIARNRKNENYEKSYHMAWGDKIFPSQFFILLKSNGHSDTFLLWHVSPTGDPRNITNASKARARSWSSERAEDIRPRAAYPEHFPYVRSSLHLHLLSLSRES